jgi:hypothetical protein
MADCGTVPSSTAEWDRGYDPDPFHWKRDGSFKSLLASLWQAEAAGSAAVCEEVTDEEIEEHFKQFAEEWSRETAHVSSADDLISHRRYQDIIRLGWRVVPYLLNDLQQNHRFWFPALYEITRVRPYDPSDSGNGKRMTEAWLQWGRWKELI